MMLIADSSISALKALLNTAIGMGTVFTVLILIALIINLFKYINQAGQKNAPVPEKKPEVSTTVVSEPEIEEMEEDLSEDLELVAVISAAIAAYTGDSVEGFRVRSIKRANNRSWK